MGDRTMPPPARGPVNPRKNFAVMPGFSMLDWGLLKTKAKNLAGQDERGMRMITKAGLREHNTEHDCWTVFRGKVYNITPFLHYHPGGMAEIMKGAGRDCTTLFDKYHPWVNFDSLVGDLCVGTFLSETDIAKAEKKAAAHDAERAASAGEGVKEDDKSADGGKGGGKGSAAHGESDVQRTAERLGKMSTAAGQDEPSRAKSADTE